MPFTTAELAYLSSQALGRLATVGADGVVQVNPVGFRILADGAVVIGGYAMAKTRKFRNVADTAGRRWWSTTSGPATRGRCGGSRSGGRQRP
jgi:PPOX class F420-dependent enzyme/OxyR family protein